MSLFREYADLSRCNTMQLPCTARFLAIVDSVKDLRLVVTSVTAKRFGVVVLGDASNMLLPPTLDTLVILPQIKGIKQLINTQLEKHEVLIEAMAGENWHHFVQYTLKQGWYGLENLSLIPGTVGASPIQNIGAYGVEVADRIVSLDAMNIATGTMHTFTQHECLFMYRDSFFKQQAGQWIVTAVRFRLSLRAELVLGYGDVAAAAGISPTPQSVANAICHIRQQKLPDPKLTPNAGSFFKNPVISGTQLASLKQQYPSLPSYAHGKDYKVAAGWLIDMAGFKGKQVGAVSMYVKQALVMVNLAAGTLQDVLALQKQVSAAVSEQFGISLEREPICLNAIGHQVIGD